MMATVKMMLYDVSSALDIEVCSENDPKVWFETRIEAQTLKQMSALELLRAIGVIETIDVTRPDDDGDDDPDE